MKASEKTAIIAEGIWHYAEVQNLYPSDQTRKAALIRNSWEMWQESHPDMVAFVKREQFDLFDRVNATL